MNNRKRPFADLSDEPLFNIKAVSQATGIEPVTLRAWERRYGVPDPDRSEQGYRLYSERDIAILRWLKSRVDAGLTIKRAVMMMRAQNPQADLPAPHVSRVAREGISLDVRLDQLLRAAHGFDALGAQRVITEAFALFPVEDVCLHLLLPALAAVGAQWRAGEASLQVEHFLTNLIRQQLLALDATMPPPSRQGTVVAGCAPEEWHEMATLMLTVFLRRQGWEVIYLGQAVGLSQLEDALATIRPDVVLLTSSTFESLDGLREAGERVMRRTQGGGTWFMYGGTLFPHVPGLADRIPGIYIGDTLPEAVQRIDGLLTGRWQAVPHVPPPISEHADHAYRTVSRMAPMLVESLAGLLREANPDQTLADVTEDVLEMLAGLQAALRLEMPELLDAPEPFIGPPLTERGVPAGRIAAVFHQLVGSDVMAILEPYLAHFWRR